MSESSEPIEIDNADDVINYRWKVTLCNQGEDCWCRLIETEQKVIYRGGTNVFVIPNGSLSKAEAEHIVEIHNAWLEAREKAKSIVEEVQSVCPECKGLMKLNRIVWECPKCGHWQVNEMKD